MGIFRTLKLYVHKSILIQLYYTLVYPYLTYGNLIWGSTNECHLSPLIVLQKKFVRAITGSSFNAHTMSLFRNNNILKVTDIHKFLVAQYMFKKFKDPAYTADIRRYATRHSHDVQPLFQRLSISQRYIQFEGPKIWNSLPVSVRPINSFDRFKRELRKHLISLYVE